MAKAIEALDKAWKESYLQKQIPASVSASSVIQEKPPDADDKGSNNDGGHLTSTDDNPSARPSEASVTTALTLDDGSRRPVGYRRTARCLLCQRTFQLPEFEATLTTHLLEAHRVLVAEPDLVADLAEYLDYWRAKLERGVDLVEFCSVVKADVVRKSKKRSKQRRKRRDIDAPDEEDVSAGGVPEEEEFFMLSDALSEDRELRVSLQRRRLEDVLHWQQLERMADPATSKWDCLFCRTSFEGWHGQLIDHMARDHNFSVGKPDNMVFVREMVDLLARRMDDNVCVYCCKVFKSREVLKEHMRKKGHKKINPADYSYDCFYVVNYQEFGKGWGAIAREAKAFAPGNGGDGFPCEDEADEDEDDDMGALTGFNSSALARNKSDAAFAEWTGDPDRVTCLFCPARYAEMEDVLMHMTSVHDFDFRDVRNTMRLDFYGQVKLVNYVRRKVHFHECIHCSKQFPDRESVLGHMTDSDHFLPPSDPAEWDRADFMFPTYENDNFLCRLDDDIKYEVRRRDGASAGKAAACDDDRGRDGEPPVESEEILALEDLAADSVLRDEDFRRSITSAGHLL